MNVTFVIASLLLLTAISFYMGRRRAIKVVNNHSSMLHSLPAYYGYYTAMWCGIPAILIYILWSIMDGSVVQMLITADIPARFPELSAKELDSVYGDIKSLTQGGIIASEPTPFMLEAVESYHQLQSTGRSALSIIAMSLAILGSTFALTRINKDFRARNVVELGITAFLIICSTVAVFTTLGIVLSVLFEAIRFFQEIPLLDFIFGLQWSPQTAIRPDQVGSTGAFGAVPLFAGTMLISFVAMMVAAPIGLFSAIYLSEYASARFRNWAKPMLEILAGVPTVVYGFFAALTVAPFLRESGSVIGLDVSSESALAAGLVMGIMIIPFISSLSDDVISAVPQSLRDGAYAMGSTQSETIRRVILPAALPGIVGGLLLGVSRAIGETMIVVMAAGLSANLTANPLEAVTTVTVQIVTLLVGDQEFDSAKTLAAFALGLILFLTTLVLNIIALYVVRRYREQYE